MIIMVQLSAKKGGFLSWITSLVKPKQISYSQSDQTQCIVPSISLEHRQQRRRTLLTVGVGDLHGSWETEAVTSDKKRVVGQNGDRETGGPETDKRPELTARPPTKPGSFGIKQARCHI